MTTFIQLLVSGMTVGAIYALVAIGFTLVYRVSDVFNLAQGEFFMLGGMIAGMMLLGGIGGTVGAVVSSSVLPSHAASACMCSASARPRPPTPSSC